MENLTEAWLSLLTEQNYILDELIVSLRDEREALLSDQLDAFKNSTLLKDKITRKLAISENKSKLLLRRSCELLGLPQLKKIKALFEYFPTQDRINLQEFRGQIARKMQRIRGLNSFTEKCLGIFVSEIEGVQSILGLARGSGEIMYGSTGGKKSSTQGGRLIDRSF